MAELKEITEITLKLRDEEINYLVSAKQGDRATRYVYAKIQSDDGTEYTIPDNCIAIVNIKKPDKHFCYNECKIENNRVIIKLTNQALAAAGTAHADIELRNEQNALILSTQSFGIEIEQSMRNENAILSSNELTALESKVQKYIDDLIKTKEEVLKVEEAVKIAEEARKQAETDRVNAESNRRANEAARQQSESDRQANEAARQQAEDGRQANEAARQQSESNRQAKEATRQQAEDNRQEKEMQRQQAEDDRKAKEATRQQAEDDRQAKETARQQSENDRQEKETARKTAETQREQLFKEYKTVMNDNTDVAKNSASSAKTSADSAKNYYEQAKGISETLSGALRPMGTVAFVNLPALSATKSGNMYNISDQFLTTVDFKEGAGNVIPAGANVYKTEDGKWDVLAGTPVTGVKGSAESVYRQGNVNITAESVGAVPVGGNAGSATTVQDYNDTSKKIKVGWVGSALNEDQILAIACYSTGDDDTVKATIKDVPKATFVNWLGTVLAANNAAHLGRNGNAGYPMTFNWAGKGGQPTWLWGGENGSDMYVYNPSNFNVSYAASAGSVNWAGIKDTPSTYPPEAHTHKLNIVSNSTFTINNYSDNPVSIVQTVDCGEYITMGNMNMRHYKLLLCTKDECKTGIVTEFDITKNNKTLVPVTSANPAQIISSNKNINLYFDIHFNYSENFGGWKWSWDEEGYITIYGGSGTADFSTKNFFWVDCWAQ
nr:MAG TPA: TolA protein [Caudoviricetes sp.]